MKMAPPTRNHYFCRGIPAYPPGTPGDPDGIDRLRLPGVAYDFSNGRKGHKAGTPRFPFHSQPHHPYDPLFFHRIVVGSAEAKIRIGATCRQSEEFGCVRWRDCLNGCRCVLLSAHGVLNERGACFHHTKLSIIPNAFSTTPYCANSAANRLRTTTRSDVWQLR
jgi:hypothetical protein